LNSQGLFFSQHHTLGVLIIVLISFFDKSMIFRLQAINILSTTWWQSCDGARRNFNFP
jgi:hypothetical protein